MSKIVLLAAVATLAAWPAAAHVSLENRQATIGAGYKAVFTVPHGCAGSPTTKIRVQIPEGVIAVKPMPKAGWSVEAISGKYATEYSYHGKKFSEGVKEVVWSGGKLADSHFLTGDNFTAADAYLFTVTGWAKYVNLDLSDLQHLQAFVARVAARPAVHAAMKAEGLLG